MPLADGKNACGVLLVVNSGTVVSESGNASGGMTKKVFLASSPELDFIKVYK